MLHGMVNVSSTSSMGSMNSLSHVGSSGALHDSNSNNTSNRDENAMYNYLTLGRIHFRSDEAALLVVDLISLAPPDVQQDLIITAMRISSCL